MPIYRVLLTYAIDNRRACVLERTFDAENQERLKTQSMKYVGELERRQSPIIVMVAKELSPNNDLDDSSDEENTPCFHCASPSDIFLHCKLPPGCKGFVVNHDKETKESTYTLSYE